MAHRVAVGNNKGGSGKTAATVNLAAALAELGKRVLVVDLDPQANASRRLGTPFDPVAPTLTTAEVIRDGGDGVAAQAVRPCGWKPGADAEGRPVDYAALIDVIPARFDLENRIAEAGTTGAVLRLRRALVGVDAEHDVTLMDCPPSLGHLTQLALAAAHEALGTVEPEYDSVEGALRYRDFIGDERSREALGNLALLLAGFIVSRVRAGVGAHTFQLDGLADTLGAELIWDPHLPEWAAVKDAADAAVPLRTLGTSRAREVAGRFTELARRVAERAA
jgi:cellulose biosynthesis protein BcsQ